MNPRAAILGCFVGSVAIITYRDFMNPDAEWPLPAPPPYRYVSAGIAFGLLALVADTLSDRIASVLAFGLLLGLGVHTAQDGLTISGGTNTWRDYLKGGGIGGATGGIAGGGAVAGAT